jgi:hypothetical protein
VAAQKSKGRITSAKKSDEVFARDLVRQIRSAEAWFTKDEVYEVDEKMKHADWVRRAGMGLLAMSGADLLEKVQSDRDAAVSLVRWEVEVEGWKKRMAERVQMVEHARARLLIALATRDDFKSVLKEAKRLDSARQGEQSPA